MSKEFICKGCGEKFNKDMQSNNVGYCYICNEFYMQKQVTDLEAKLAEREKFMKDNGFKNLEELDNYIQKIHSHYDEVKNKGTCGLCEKIDNEQIKELKQQLSEKDKELNKFKSIGATPRQLQRAYQERFKYNERCSELKKQHIQNKINFAVSYLEVIKAFIIDKEFYFTGEDYSTVYVEDITEEIDNQIKELKEMK